MVNLTIKLCVQRIIGSRAVYLIITWCVEKKGPVFTAAFIPIIQIMVATIAKVKNIYILAIANCQS